MCLTSVLGCASRFALCSWTLADLSVHGWASSGADLPSSRSLRHPCTTIFKSHVLTISM